MSITSEARTYHISPWRRWVIWFVFGPIILGLLALGVTSGWAQGQAFLFTAACAFVIALPFHFLIDRARLEVSPEGVRLRQTGYQLEALWDNVAELRLDRAREGFVTNAPIPGKGATRLAAFRGVGIAGAPMFSSQQQALLAEQRFIPIEAFAWH
ncbi:MAG: hypothetical protein DLM52_00670, partial [Chthoniobacterales bacterium]